MKSGLKPDEPSWHRMPLPPKPSKQHFFKSNQNSVALEEGSPDGIGEIVGRGGHDLNLYLYMRF